MYTLERIKKEIANEINRALKKKVVKASDLTYPPDAKMGDLSLPCFAIAKELKKSTAEVASLIVGKAKAAGMVTATKTVSSYVNFNLRKNELAKDVIREIERKRGEYGENKVGRAKKIILEFSNGNTHKELHIGHLRNICLGDALTKITRANGYQSIPISYVNDFGIHVAKTIWAYLKFYKNETLPENKGYFLGKVYIRASQEIEKDPAAKEMVNFIMRKIEARQGEEYKIWQETRQWSIDQLAKTCEELGVSFTKIFYESEVIDSGKQIVKKLLARGILKNSEGAVIADLEKFGLGVLVVLRSDGTATYPVADLALAQEKFSKFKSDKSIYIVDVRQSLYFKQLFKLLNLLGYKKEMVHLGYEFVKLPTGMMASRTGNVITYESLRDKIFARAQAETKARHKDWSEEQVQAVVKEIALGVMKFEMIKVGADQVITFDIDKALSFSGFTAAYLQYTCARFGSIMRKSEEIKSQSKIDYSLLADGKENELIMALAKHPEAVARAGAEYNPSEIAKYLFELAQLANDYYHQVPILKAEEKVRAVRLALIKAVNQVLSNGLELLGIGVLKEM
ncbi:MAG: arginine--tRNA ligase [Candidatus Falkowbacteria bacterium]|nr:arginine--tRNA ligase [Candidatus Falkowbacteria bacterium]